MLVRNRLLILCVSFANFTAINQALALDPGKKLASLVGPVGSYFYLERYRIDEVSVDGQFYYNVDLSEDGGIIKEIFVSRSIDSASGSLRQGDRLKISSIDIEDESVKIWFSGKILGTSVDGHFEAQRKNLVKANGQVNMSRAMAAIRAYLICASDDHSATCLIIE